MPGYSQRIHKTVFAAQDRSATMLDMILKHSVFPHGDVAVGIGAALDIRLEQRPDPGRIGDLGKFQLQISRKRTSIGSAAWVRLHLLSISLFITMKTSS